MSAVDEAKRSQIDRREIHEAQRNYIGVDDLRHRRTIQVPQPLVWIPALLVAPWLTLASRLLQFVLDVLLQ